MKIIRSIRAANIFIMAVMLIAVAPIMYFGQNSLIAIHDNLDSTIPWIKMLKDNGLLLALDSPTNCLGNMSTAYFSIPFNLLIVPYLLFDTFTAYVIGHVLIKILVGYCSMLLLLRHLFPHEENAAVIKLVSLCFALLPVAPGFGLAVDSMPLLCYFFCVIKEWTPRKIDNRIFLLVFFPLLSSFPMAGFFLLCLWAFGSVALWLYQQRFHWNLAAGLASLTIGYVLVDLKIFYAKFVLREPLNRALMLPDPYGVSFEQAMQFAPADFLYGGAYWGYHAPVFASKVIFPTVFVAVFSIGTLILYRLVRNRYEKNIKKLTIYFLISLALLGISIIFSLIGTLYRSSEIVVLVGEVLPFLSGFNWGRFSFLNRTVLYILFALTLIMLLQCNKFKYMAYIIPCLQIFVILIVFISHTRFFNNNDENIYLYNKYNNFTYNFKKLLKQMFNTPYDEITYAEFFSESFFHHIKTDLQYSGEGVAALGYHPGVLMYNGFSTIDGYNNAYPLRYALAFREVIAPQLALNAGHKKYYDSWAGRMYLYNDEVNEAPTRARVGTSVTLHINVEAFRKLGGRYILSRAEIGNAEELRLRYIRKYSNSNAIYEIFVYEAL